MVRKLEATAIRDGKWWFIQIPELDTVGQARRISEISDAAHEVAALWLNVDPSEVEVSVTVLIPDDVKSLWMVANEQESTARDAVKEAARLRREAVRMLADRGITQRDSARLLGLSTQRVNQLTHS